MSVKINVRGSNLEGALAAFKTAMIKSGTLALYKENQQYLKPSEKKRIKWKKARAKKAGRITD